MYVLTPLQFLTKVSVRNKQCGHPAIAFQNHPQREELDCLKQVPTENSSKDFPISTQKV